LDRIIRNILFSFGTRPEAIKLVPLISELLRRDIFKVTICVTAQHREMLDQVLELFRIRPDYDLNVMIKNQSLSYITRAILEGVTDIIKEVKPDCVVVQGDTTTTLASALAAFYQQIPVAHIEAGLRTHQKYAPFPEEINRRMTSCLTTWHFAPTAQAKDELLRENYSPDQIYVVGNTVIDALLSMRRKAEEARETIIAHLPNIDWLRPFILVTGHRRENFGEGFKNICYALHKIAECNTDIEIVYPVHLNPNVQHPVKNILSGQRNIHLIEPQNYLTFTWLLDRCKLVLTDSGGIQEEAPSLGKPVLVMRETTERPEAIEAGVALLVGTNKELIIREVQRLLDDGNAYQAMSRAQNPYGDGTSSVQIADILQRELNLVK